MISYSCRLSDFPSYKSCSSDRPGAVKGAPSARRSEPFTARTDLESFEERERGFDPARPQLPTKNTEDLILDRSHIAVSIPLKNT